MHVVLPDRHVRTEVEWELLFEARPGTCPPAGSRTVPTELVSTGLDGSEIPTVESFESLMTLLRLQLRLRSMLRRMNWHCVGVRRETTSSKRCRMIPKPRSFQERACKVSLSARACAGTAGFTRVLCRKRCNYRKRAPRNAHRSR